jgi:hypothetical protein
MNKTFEYDTLELPTAESKKSPMPDKAFGIINSIDLTMVKMKLMDEEEGQGWDQAYCEEIENLYRRYLCMLYLDFEAPHVPTIEIDLFWHQHILDTRAYAKDCQTIFGQFLHHFPYFGMRGEEDAKNLNDAFEETKKFYFELFGEAYCEETSSCKKCSCSSKCGVSQCSKT